MDELRRLISRPVPASADEAYLASFEPYRENIQRFAGINDDDPRVWRGDLLALHAALERCAVARFPDNPGSEQLGSVRAVPSWLLAAVSALLWDGLGGHWPKGDGRQARAAQRQLDAMRDLIRAMHVLKARENGIAWEEVFKHVASTVRDAGRPKTIEGAYLRVVGNLRNDSDYYLRMSLPHPRVLEAAVGMPERGGQE